MRYGRATLAITTALAAALVGAAPATAAPPRAVVVPCGAVLTSSVRLAADVVCPAGGGVVLAADGIELNLNGHAITGPGAGTPSVGVFLDAQDVVVRNGRVAGWGTGVAAYSEADPEDPPTTGGTVRNARLEDNGVGVAASTGGDVVVRSTSMTGNSRGGTADFGGRLRVENSTAQANGTGFFSFSVDVDGLTIRDTLIRDNRGAGVSCSQDGHYDVSGSTLQRNRVGLDVFECGGIVQNSRFVWNRQHVGGYLVPEDRIDLICNSYTRDGGPVEFPVQPCPPGVTAPVIAGVS